MSKFIINFLVAEPIDKYFKKVVFNQFNWNDKAILGYAFTYIVRKVIVGGGGILLAAAPLAPATEGEVKKPNPCIRPRDLPIYDAPSACPPVNLETASTEPGYLQKVLEPPVKEARIVIQTAIYHADGLKNVISEKIKESQDKTNWIVKYLREEENKSQRYGAVVIGGLTGLILGSRGGFMKKLFYTGFGTSFMGAICFPAETEDIGREVASKGRRYANVAYNFFYGVKPGDPQLEMKFPELSFPTTVSEFVDLSVGLAATVKQAVMPPPSAEQHAEKKAD